jgi:defect-in-organelle-trafficking protein DotC
LPKNQLEATVWNHYIAEGWQNGILQAQSIFAANLSRLKRDYLGMILYCKLYSKHMVSAPFVAKANLGITGDTHALRINDKVLRITDHSKLETDPNAWKAVLETKGTSRYK